MRRSVVANHVTLRGYMTKNTSPLKGSLGIGAKMSKLCHNDIEWLMRLWYTHPWLWDASSAAYSNVNMRRRAVRTIATELHVWEENSAWRLTAGAWGSKRRPIRQLIDSCINIIPSTAFALFYFILLQMGELLNLLWVNIFSGQHKPVSVKPVKNFRIYQNFANFYIRHRESRIVKIITYPYTVSSTANKHWGTIEARARRGKRVAPQCRGGVGLGRGAVAPA